MGKKKRRSSAMGVGAGPGMGFRPNTTQAANAAGLAPAVKAGLAGMRGLASNLGRYVQHGPNISGPPQPDQGTLTEGIFGAGGPVQEWQRRQQSAADLERPALSIEEWAQGLPLPTVPQAQPSGFKAMNVGASPVPAGMPPPQAQPPVNPLIQGMMAANPSMVGPGRTHQDIANQSPGIPYGYAQAGVNPAVGNPQGIAQPTLNPLGGGTGALEEDQRRAAQNAMMGEAMRATRPPEGAAALPWSQSASSPGTFREWLDARKTRKQALAAGEEAPYVPGWEGRGPERNLSTTELLQGKAALSEGAPGQARAQRQLTRMRDRFAEKRDARTPLSLRRAMVTAKAQGRPLTPFGAMLEQAVAGGEDLSADQRMAAGGGQYAAAMQQMDPDVMNRQGAWGTRQAFATNENPAAAMAQGNMMRNLMPPGMGGAQQQLPTEGPLAGLTPEQSTMVQQYSEAGNVDELERYLRFQNVPPEQIEEILQVASGRYAAPQKFQLRPSAQPGRMPPLPRLGGAAEYGRNWDYGPGVGYRGLLK